MLSGRLSTALSKFVPNLPFFVFASSGGMEDLRFHPFTFLAFLQSNEVLSDSSLQNIQSLLILSTVGDLHAQPASMALSAASMRLSVAIRMVRLSSFSRFDQTSVIYLKLKLIILISSAS